MLKLAERLDSLRHSETDLKHAMLLGCIKTRSTYLSFCEVPVLVLQLISTLGVNFQSLCLSWWICTRRKAWVKNCLVVVLCSLLADFMHWGDVPIGRRSRTDCTPRGWMASGEIFQNEIILICVGSTESFERYRTWKWWEEYEVVMLEPVDLHW